MPETRRLIIKPLSYEQLVQYARCDNSLESALNLKATSRTVSPELKEALVKTILPNVKKSGKNYLYSTLWIAILKAENKMVGDLCFYGEPNAKGEVEIGYGTYDEFQNKGFMTEIVEGMIEWAKLQPKILSIIASTDQLNTASYKVLKKNGFIKTGETDSEYIWKLDLNKE
jgi:RimJ/RimL family protein N-acetyltransferase